VHNEEIMADFLVEEHSTVNPFVVDTSRVVYDFPVQTLYSIRRDICALARKLNLTTGLIHTQFIKNESQYWIIEVTRRCPGDLYSQLIEFSTGINYAENYVRPFLKYPFSIQSERQRNWIMRHTVTNDTDFIFNSIEYNSVLKIRKWISLATTGSKLRASPYGRVGVLFAEEGSEKDLNCLFKATKARKLYKIFSS